MDNINREPVLPSMLVREGAFQGDPFVLIDVGVSGGIHSVWREFGLQLVAFGFDPQQSECQRLQEAETNPLVKYVPAFVGLSEDHPFAQRRKSENPAIFRHFNPWDRLSTAQAAARSAGPTQSQPTNQQLADPKKIIGISEFVRSSGIANVDFIKIDVDGLDLDVLISSEDIIRSHSVLGFAIEVNWTGSYLDTDNSFHNIDRKMRQLGFSLVDVNFRRYSRRALPLPFVLNLVAQTVGGQVIQGDAVYVRDVASPYDTLFWGTEPTPTKVLKVAAIYDIFNLRDMAAEVVEEWRSQIEVIVNPTLILDALTPSLRGKSLHHSEYIREFETNIGIFFPQRSSLSGFSEPDGEPNLAAEVKAPLKEHMHVINLEGYVINNDASVSKDGDALLVSTPKEMWSYAISFPLQGRDVAAGPGEFKLEVSVTEGVIGIGALGADNKTFLDEIHCVSSGSWQTVNLRVSEISECKAVVVRNVAHSHLSSRVRIRSISAIVWY